MSQEEMTAIDVFRTMLREELDAALGPIRIALGRLEVKLGDASAHEQAAQDAGVIAARRTILRRNDEIKRQHGAKIPAEDAAPAEVANVLAPEEVASHAPPPLRRPKKPKLCPTCEGTLVFDGEASRCLRCGAS